MVEAVADSLTTLRESTAIPETEELRGAHGFGPAASKVYRRDEGLSLGGYGEMFLGHRLGGKSDRKPHRADLYRAILYVGHRFSDKILVNTEIEFEHGTTGSNPVNGETGSVSVEFAYLDFLLHDAINIRSGLMLMPMGITNEMHEPTVYRGNMRPETERRIIPSTWRELGLGAFGQLPGGVSYNLYGVSGLAVDGFGEKGIRGGRQKGNHVAFEDKAAVAALGWAWRDHIALGTSFYYGGADHDPAREAPQVTLWISEAHAILRFRGAELRGLVATSHIEGAARLDDRTPAQQVEGASEFIADPSRVVPTDQFGGYGEASYNVFSAVGSIRQQLTPFIRAEALNLNLGMIEGQVAKAELNTLEVTAGLEYKPHPQVVIKAEYGRRSDAANGSDAIEELRVGTGFVF